MGEERVSKRKEKKVIKQQGDITQEKIMDSGFRRFGIECLQTS